MQKIKQIKTLKSPKRQQGFSMVDLMLWAGGLVLGIGILYGIFGPLMTTLKTHGLSSELQTFQLKIQEVYHGQNNGYTGISVAEVVKSSAYPTDLNVTSTTLSSSSTGNITISSDDGSGLTFSVQFDAVPSGVCRGVINKLSSAGGWSEISVGGTSIWAGTSTNPTKAAIDTACNASSAVTMKFISN